MLAFEPFIANVMQRVVVMMYLSVYMRYGSTLILTLKLTSIALFCLLKSPTYNSNEKTG